jgi:hypothetical protein
MLKVRASGAAAVQIDHGLRPGVAGISPSAPHQSQVPRKGGDALRIMIQWSKSLSRVHNLAIDRLQPNQR